MLPDGSACIRRPRAATTASASSSDMTPAQMRRSILADAVTKHDFRCHTPATPQASKRIFDDEQCWLREACFVDGRIMLFGKNQILRISNSERGSSSSAHRSIASRKACALRRDPAPIPACWTALPAEQEGNRARVALVLPVRTGARCGCRSRSTACASLLTTTARRCANAWRPTCKCPFDVRERLIRFAHPRSRRDSSWRCSSAVAVLADNNKEMGACAGRSVHRWRRFFEHDVGIGAADAERTHARPPWCHHRWTRLTLGRWPRRGYGQGQVAD